MAQWYCKTLKGIDGPFSDKELIRLRHDGKLCETDYVREGSAENWIVAKRVKGLFDTSQPIPPPPPRVLH